MEKLRDKDKNQKVEHRTVGSLNNFDKESAKWRQFGYTIMQWILSVVVIIFAGICANRAYEMSTVPALRYGSQFVAEFSVLLVIGLAGGMIPKADYPIHTIGRELWHVRDWHENLRSLYRKKWLNVVPDIFGLLAGLFIFCFSNLTIWHKWNFLVPASLVILMNCVLLLVAVAMIPASCEEAKKEVDEQVKINQSLRS